MIWITSYSYVIYVTSDNEDFYRSSFHPTIPAVVAVWCADII